VDERPAGRNAIGRGARGRGHHHAVGPQGADIGVPEADLEGGQPGHGPAADHRVVDRRGGKDGRGVPDDGHIEQDAPRHGEPVVEDLGQALRPIIQPGGGHEAHAAEVDAEQRHLVHGALPGGRQHGAVAAEHHGQPGRRGHHGPGRSHHRDRLKRVFPDKDGQPPGDQPVGHGPGQAPGLVVSGLVKNGNRPDIARRAHAPPRGIPGSDRIRGGIRQSPLRHKKRTGRELPPAAGRGSASPGPSPPGRRPGPAGGIIPPAPWTERITYKRAVGARGPGASCPRPPEASSSSGNGERPQFPLSWI